MSEQDEQMGVDKGRQDAGGTEQKTVPVTEAIRYRKRAQTAEQELAQAKEQLAQQGQELAALKEHMESRTAEPAVHAGVRTQGVKETRTGGARQALDAAAARAAESGRRADLQTYLHLRRSYV